MKGTRVIVKSVEKDAMLPDTLYTEETGEYLFKDDSAWPKMTYRVVCEDPDGIYKADSVDVKMTPTGGDGNWYGGSDSKEVNFKLTKKKDS